MTIQAPDPVSGVAKAIEWIVIGLVILVVLGSIWYIDHLRGKVSDQAAEIKTYQVTNKNLGDAVDTCNAGVQRIKDEGDARAAVAAQAVKAAQTESAKISQEAAAIMSAKPTESDDCKATKAFLDDYYRRKP